MHQETEVEILASEAAGAKYDETCRMLFLNKEIVAPILKEVVPEYQGRNIDEVLACIDGELICSDPVDDVSVRVNALPTEMSSVSDKLIRYDSRFLARNPKLSTETIEFYLHIDIEVQNKYKPSNPSYPIIKRAIYYAAREISSQLGVLTEKTNYTALQKVYSIWICNEDIPEELQNTVSSYSLTRSDMIGMTAEPASDYDLMTVIMIRRGNDEGTEPIFDYLTGIFQSDLTKISEYVNVDRNERLKDEVRTLSGLGMSIAAKNLQKGRAEGADMILTLISRLLSAGRSEDIERVTKDPEYCNKLMKEFQILPMQD